MNHTLNILLIGKGGRESAMAWKLLDSPRLGTLYTAPGYHPGAIQATGLDLGDFDAVREFVERHAIDMVVIGPTDFVASGLPDALREEGIPVVAPRSGLARLETSKELAKEFMAEAIIPTPRSMSVTLDTLDEGMAFMETRTPPYVIKANGTAHGCGVEVLDNLADAKDMLADMLDGRFGTDSDTVIIEDYVSGPECSVIVATDGKSHIILPPVRDYKRLSEGDTGPNTAGMGSYSPVSWVSDEFLENVDRRIVTPTLTTLRNYGAPYAGFLFFGIKNDNGEPVLLEYNTRMGDPEAQVLMPRMESDLIDLLEAIVDERVADLSLQWSPQACAAIVVAGQGYPTKVSHTEPVTGLEDAREAGCLVFCDDITTDAAGRLVTGGARALTVAALGGNVAVAAELAREGAELIRLEGKRFRSDIGLSDIGV